MDTIAVDTMPGQTERAHDLARWLPIAGVGYAVLQMAGNLNIGDFPDENTSIGRLAGYYAVHHAGVHLGGTLLGVSVAFLGLFVAALLVRSRHTGAAVAVIAVGGAVAVTQEAMSAATYSLLGTISTDPHVTPAALQAWHISGAAYGNGVGMTLLLLGVAAAGFLGKVVPTWLAWPALVIAVALWTPYGFAASLLFLLWCAVAGVTLAVRPSSS